LNKDLNKFNQQSSGNQKKNKALLQKLIKLDDKKVDSLFQNAHEKVFACTDCLQCANCCKTTGPLFTASDIKRISAKLKLTEKEFVKKYLRKDEDDDMVLQQVPCAFLAEDNRCNIYEFRPKACRAYPHTDQEDQSSIYHLTLKNATVCPAVSDILDEIRAKIK
jgi:Fe-S-cluster containining protein